MWWLGGFLILLPAAQTRAYFPQGLPWIRDVVSLVPRLPWTDPQESRGSIAASHPRMHLPLGFLPTSFEAGQDRPAGPREGVRRQLGSGQSSPWGDRRLPISPAAEMLCPRETLLFVYCDSKELWRELWFILNSYCGSKHPCLFLCL